VERADSLQLAKIRGWCGCVRDWSQAVLRVVIRVCVSVELIVMEATGDYWKPFYYLREDAPFEVRLVNARHPKNTPGRKTDVDDAEWLAQLGAQGLVRGSFVPPEPVRPLRDTPNPPWLGESSRQSRCSRSDYTLKRNSTTSPSCMT
jgi:Transposase